MGNWKNGKNRRKNRKQVTNGSILFSFILDLAYSSFRYRQKEDSVNMRNFFRAIRNTYRIMWIYWHIQRFVRTLYGIETWRTFNSEVRKRRNDVEKLVTFLQGTFDRIKADIDSHKKETA